MPWPVDHSEKTRARILRVAASEFRARGIDAVGIVDVMKRAGLTHGAFYAHFTSKEQLVAEALQCAGTETLALLGEALRHTTRGSPLSVVIDRYLSSEHLDHPERGCPLATLAPELSRGRRGKSQLSRAIRARLRWLGGIDQSAGQPAVSAEEIAGALACMVGGVVLARGLPRAEGRALLEQCRTFLERSLRRSGARGRTHRRR